MKIPPSVIAPLAYVFYRIWSGSLRYVEKGREMIDQLSSQNRPMVFALWHDELFPLMQVRRDLRIVAIVSRSRDGEFLARLLLALGLKTARGSSSRGGESALLETARLMKNDGLNACITVDGPRGPRHSVKKGAVYLSHKTGAPIVPVRIFMERSKKFGSWDKFQLPWLFSKVEVVYGEPYNTPEADMTDETIADECQRLQKKLESLTPETITLK